jgi:hypothetical protein
MDAGGGGGKWPKRAEIERWVAVPGGILADGSVVTRPVELEQAQAILRLCDRFKKLPSEILAEDAELFRLITLEDLGRTDEPQPGECDD